MRKMWVLKDFENNYITANRCFILTDEGWLYGTFSGRTTGFSYYSDKSIAVKELENLRNLNNKHKFDKRFYLEYIDIKKIPYGERNVKKIKNNKNFLLCAK